MSTDFDSLRTASLTFVAVGQTCFVLLYTTFPWWRSFLGRALFYKALMLMLIVDLFLLTRIFQWDNMDTLFVTLYTLLGVGVWVQFFAFLKVRSQGKQNQTNPNSVTDTSEVSGNEAP